MQAVDVQRMAPHWLSWERVYQGLPTADLPVCEIGDPISQRESTAVLSWRWDVNPHTGRSRNVGLAVKHVHEQGIRYLCIDLVSVDQRQTKHELLKNVVGLADLYGAIPVIGAYEEPDPALNTAADALGATLARPWILSEVRAYSVNPTNVTNVWFQRDSTHRRDLRFANEVSVIRSAGYAACILEILCGRAAMTDIADFSYILSGFNEVVSACYSRLDRADYLFAVFLLTARYEKHQVVQRDDKAVNYGFRTDVGDMPLESLGLKRFTHAFAANLGKAFESAYEICIDSQPVAIWRSKMTSSFDRNWVEVLPEAEVHIFDAIGLAPEARRAYSERPASRTDFLRISREAPRPSIRERAVRPTGDGWLMEIPAPQATTLGFDPELWK